MKRLFIILFICTNFIIGAYCQTTINCYDSIGRKHGLWQLDKELYCKKIKNNDCKSIVVGIEKGIYFHGHKTGFWSITTKGGKLFKQEFYDNDTLTLVITYVHNRIFSISKVEYVPSKENDKNINGVYINTDVTIFNKFGSPKKRIFKSVNGEVINEKY